MEPCTCRVTSSSNVPCDFPLSRNWNLQVCTALDPVNSGLPQSINVDLIGKMHFEKRRGTRSQARNYCMKEDTRAPDHAIMEIGKFSASDRTDLSTMYQMAVNGRSERDIAMSFPASYMRYHKGVKQIKAFYMPERDDEPMVVLLSGLPGTGKTSTVLEGADDLWKSAATDALQWFDGYDQHNDVLLDEFAGRMSKCPLTTFLALIDRYSQRVPTKGSFTSWAPKRIFITTNYHPVEWYDWSTRGPQWFALVRRFTHVLHFKRAYSEPTVYKRGPGSTPVEWNYAWRKWWGHPTEQLELSKNDTTEAPMRMVRKRKVFDINTLSMGKQKAILGAQGLMKKYLQQ